MMRGVHKTVVPLGRFVPLTCHGRELTRSASKATTLSQASVELFQPLEGEARKTM